MKKSLTILLMMVVFSCEIVTKQIYASNQNMVGDLSIRKDGRACNEPHKILGHLSERGREMPKGIYDHHKIRGEKRAPFTREHLNNLSKAHKGQKRSKKSIEKQRQSMMGKLVKDLRGRRFGRLLVIREAGRSKDERVLWGCICDCGKKKTVRGHDLVQSKIKSCGCLMGVPGISRRSRAYDKWRLAVFERDNYTCVSCDKVGGRLHAHHIKSYDDYPELRLVVSNGSTLCPPCHAKLQPKHKKKVIRCG